jgi:hypothetical protein
VLKSVYESKITGRRDSRSAACLLMNSKEDFSRGGETLLPSRQAQRQSICIPADRFTARGAQPSLRGGCGLRAARPSPAWQRIRHRVGLRTAPRRKPQKSICMQAEGVPGGFPLRQDKRYWILSKSLIRNLFQRVIRDCGATRQSHPIPGLRDRQCGAAATEKQGLFSGRRRTAIPCCYCLLLAGAWSNGCEFSIEDFQTPIGAQTGRS